jgi:hypothetical protein
MSLSSGERKKAFSKLCDWYIKELNMRQSAKKYLLEFNLKDCIKFPSLYQIWLTFLTDCLKSSGKCIYRALWHKELCLFHTVCISVTWFSQVQVVCVYSINSCLVLAATGSCLCGVRTCAQKHTFLIYSLIISFNTGLPLRQRYSKRPFPSDFQINSPNILSTMHVQVAMFTFSYFFCWLS